MIINFTTSLNVYRKVIFVLVVVVIVSVALNDYIVRVGCLSRRFLNETTERAPKTHCGWDHELNVAIGFSKLKKMTDI